MIILVLKKSIWYTKYIVRVVIPMKKKKLKGHDIKRSEGAIVKSIVYKIKMREVEYTVASVFSIVLIIIISFFTISSSVQEHKNYNTLKVGKLQVAFNEIENNTSEIIYLDHKSKISDNNINNLKDYTFKIKNSANKRKKFTVKIVDDDEMIDSDKCRNKLLDKDYIKYSIEKNDVSKLNKTGIIINSTLEKNSSKTYKIKVWVDNNYTGNDDFHYHGKFIIEEK